MSIHIFFTTRDEAIALPLLEAMQAISQGAVNYSL